MTANTSSPLLETKLYVPRLRRGVVARPRLSQRLSRGVESKLTLISAPAGFGKSTLLAEWLATVPSDPRTVAWLSLDPGDNQPAPFWTYVIKALQTVAPEAGATALALLQAPQPPPIESVLATLLNDLGALATDIVLVLDDYHLVDAHEIQDRMAFLLEHLPPQIHVVIATRADPGLPLARFRGRGELVEVRAADLRFTPDEAAAYLNEVMGLDLEAADVAALETRTEGWIAALQLAALSMQGRDDIAGFIATFAGDDRYIVDYLVEEVLQRQSAPVRSFLLETSILSRLSGPLCDAVTGADDGRTMLEALDRANLFLVPLDDRRRWYRYHQLFADVLLAHLQDEHPDRIPELHRRAGEWYERNGERSEAIRHALAAGDFPRAADLIELAVPALRQGRQEAGVLAWFRALPDEVIAARPVLSVHYAGTLLIHGQVEGAEARLQDAERWLDTTVEGQARPNDSSAEPIVVDEEEFRRLPAAIAVFRAALALAVGDAAGTIGYARRALDLVDEADHLGRGSAAGLLGLAYWTNGDLERADRSYADSMANLEQAGYLSDTLGCAVALADIRIAQGRLREAMSTYEPGLRRASEAGAALLRGTADLHVGMSELYLERNDLDAALRHLMTSKGSGEHLGLPRHAFRWRVVMARIRTAEGDLAGALDLLDEADRRYLSDFYPNVRPIAALRARIWIAQGRSAEALGWSSAQGLTADDELSYLHEFEHITLARALMSQSATRGADRDDRTALKLLGRLLEAAEAGRRTGSVIEILVLQALAHRSEGDIRAALVPLERALSMAEPEGYVRIFIDEGSAMTALLEAATKQGVAPGYVRRLLAGLAATDDRTPVRQALIEPLSERELDVLRLLGSDLNGPDIARELVVSLNTVRSHTKNIFAKLGVNSRRAAVSRAAELGLLTRTRPD